MSEIEHIEYLLDKYDNKIRSLILESDELKAIQLCSDLAVIREIIIIGWDSMQSQINNLTAEIDAINKEGDEDESQQEQSV